MYLMTFCVCSVRRIGRLPLGSPTRILCLFRGVSLYTSTDTVPVFSWYTLVPTGCPTLINARERELFAYVRICVSSRSSSLLASEALRDCSNTVCLLTCYVLSCSLRDQSFFPCRRSCGEDSICWCIEGSVVLRLDLYSSTGSLIKESVWASTDFLPGVASLSADSLGTCLLVSVRFGDGTIVFLEFDFLLECVSDKIPDFTCEMPRVDFDIDVCDAVNRGEYSSCW